MAAYGYPSYPLYYLPCWGFHPSLLVSPALIFQPYPLVSSQSFSIFGISEQTNDEVHMGIPSLAGFLVVPLHYLHQPLQINASHQVFAGGTGVFHPVVNDAYRAGRRIWRRNRQLREEASRASSQNNTSGTSSSSSWQERKRY